MLMFEVAANLVMLAVLYLIVRDTYRSEGGLFATLAFFIPLYALYRLFFKMGEERTKAITLWCFGILVMFLPHFPPVNRVLHRDDVCTILKAEDITHELGYSVRDIQSAHEGGACRYALGSEPANALVFRMAACDPGTIADIQKRDRAFPVSEIGDEAASIGRELWVRHGQQCYVVFLEKASPQEDTLQARKNLVAKVIGLRGR